MGYFFKRFVYLLILPLLYIVYFFSNFVPRDNSIWVFGSWNGKRFADNSKWFYLYCQKETDGNTQYIWITRDKSISASLRDKNYKAFYLYTPQGFWYSVRGGVYIIDSFSRDISFWLSHGAQKVLLQHGVPIKKIGHDIDNKNNLFYKCYHGNWLEKISLRVLQPWWAEKYNLIPATSEYCSECFQTAFNVSSSTAPVTGFPRNDVLFNSSLKELEITQKKNDINQFIEYDYIVLYMPTFRDTDRDNRHIPIDLDKINTLFKKHSAIFLLKLHPNERFDLDVQRFSNIEALDPEYDVYSGIQFTDLLITDYSSISLDFMNANKNVVFYTYDFEHYMKKDRSLYIDFKEVMQGQPEAGNFLELYTILNCYLNGNQSFGWSTQVMCEKFHYYSDGKNSERILNAIQKQLID